MDLARRQPFAGFDQFIPRRRHRDPRPPVHFHARDPLARQHRRMRRRQFRSRRAKQRSRFDILTRKTIILMVLEGLPDDDPITVNDHVLLTDHAITAARNRRPRHDPQCLAAFDLALEKLTRTFLTDDRKSVRRVDGVKRITVKRTAIEGRVVEGRNVIRRRDPAHALKQGHFFDRRYLLDVRSQKFDRLLQTHAFHHSSPPTPIVLKSLRVNRSPVTTLGRIRSKTVFEQNITQPGKPMIGISPL